jgi:hypothetical protein
MKKLSSLIIYCTLLLCTIILFSLNSCSKDVDPTSADPISLNAEKSQYAPYEIVTIAASDNLFTVQTFTAKINDIEISVSSNDNIASFVLPNLADGNYNLSFTLNEKNYTVPITVYSLSNILSADQYFNEVLSGINQNISDLNTQINQLEQNSTNPSEYANLQSDVIKYTTLLNDYTNSYNNLSVIEKQEFAKTMAANKASIDEYNNLTVALQSSTASLRTAQSTQDYETAVQNSMIAFSASVIYTVAHIPFIIAGANLAATTLNPGVILACGIVTGSFLVNTSITITGAISLTNKSIKPFEFISQTSQTIYSNSVETVSDIRAKYRSIINSDDSNSSNGGTINTIVEKYNYIKEKYNGFINDLPSIFRPSYIMTSLKNTYNSTTRAIYNQYVNITNISNPNVTLQKIDQPDGSIKIKVSTTETTAQNFTYDINYTNSNFTNGLTKTVDAQVSGLDPCNQGTMTAPVITNVELVCNTSNRISILVSFTANGTGALIYGGSGWCDPTTTCYPTRLYFFSPGATDYTISHNGYNVSLKSGNSNSGVIEITPIGIGGMCINGQTAAQSFESNYQNYDWKVELMNECNQRSNQVSF